MGIEHVYGAYRFSSRGQFVDDAYVEVAVESHGKGAWYGGCGHDEDMRRHRVLHPEFGTLCHTEAVLLVNHHKAQLMEEYIVLDDGMSTHKDVDFAPHQSFEHSGSFLPLHCASEQLHPDGEVAQKLAQGVKVLFCQNLGGCHDAGLVAIVDGDECHHESYQRFAASHVALQKPVHLSSRLHVGSDFLDDSLLGIGERTGNVPLEAMVFEYASLRGSLDGMDPTVITEIAEYFKNEIGYNIPPMTPFVGRSFNVTRAGIHADGLLKDEEIYNIFNTEKILNRPANVAVSKNSGLAGIAYWLNKNYGLKGDKELSKHSKLVEEMKAWVDSQYEDGRTTALSQNELESKAEELSGGILKKKG